MVNSQLPARLLLVTVAGLTVAHASDRVAVYARIDKVVLAPNAEAPDTVQVWGVFSIADANNNPQYLPAARGYLYFKLAANPEAARREWNDFKQVAGTDQIVAFGNRYSVANLRLRKSTERPKNPDGYEVNSGVSKIRARTDYGPIRAVLEFKD